MEELREKSINLTGYMEFLVNHYFNEQKRNHKVKVHLITPGNPERRGCQLSLKFNCDIALIYK
jgi:kynureninase